MVLMKSKILFPLLFILGLSIGACSSSGSSFNSGSNGLDSSSNNQRSSSSRMSFPSYSSSFEEKETGLSLDQITEDWPDSPIGKEWAKVKPKEGDEDFIVL